MLETILIVIHVLVCFFLIFVVVVLDFDVARAFGGGGSQTALGMRGAATLLQKLTTVSAIVFMLTSLALGIAGRSESSVIDDLEAPVSAPVQQEQAPEAGAGTGGQ